MAATGDVAILISQSGETTELDPVIDHFRHVGIPIIAITGNSSSMLAKAAAAALVLPHWPEVGPESVAPTTSTTMTLALGDALAMTVMRQKGFTRSRLWKAASGRIARRATEARQPPHAFGSEALPLTRRDSLDARHDRRDVGQAAGHRRRCRRMQAISSARSPTAILRRHIEQGLDHSAAEFMTRGPQDGRGRTRWSTMRWHCSKSIKITALFVVDETDGKKPVGVLHIHDCPPQR